MDLGGGTVRVGGTPDAAQVMAAIEDAGYDVAVRGMSTVTLAVGGMTCASCAARIEKRLNRIDGVQASRQLRHRAGIDRLPRLRDPRRPGGRRRGHRLHGGVARPRAARRETYLAARLLVSAALSVPVLLVSMVSALQFAGWQWLALA